MKRWSIAKICLLVFAGGFVVFAFEPRYPRAWVLEHLPTVVVLPVVIWWAKRGLLSERALVQITLFGFLHLYGAHYTYANTPLGFALRDALQLSRNHYDRIAHFGFGLLWVHPLRELAFPKPIGVARELAITLGLIGGISLLYEQAEWITASLADPGAGIAFLGTQGDVWDAQKDATAATFGSLVALLGERQASSC